MPRVSINYVCSSCGFQSPKWYGRCPECGEWNTLSEQIDETNSRKSRGALIEPVSAVRLSEVEPEKVGRFSSGLTELDRTLGGGFVPGSLLLMAGEPGIGKSTLLLSVADNVAGSFGRVLYVSGEESVGQVKIRADRLGVRSPDLYFACERDIDRILELCNQLNPSFLVIDSIQTLSLIHI